MPAETHNVVLEQDVRLSQSMLWQLQRQLYQRAGARAWADGLVPAPMGDNPRLASAYAVVLRGWLEDLTAAGARPDDATTYIVELGAGSGRLAFRVLSALRRLLVGASIGAAPVKYVMTEFHDGLVEHWRTHAGLRPFLDAGLLDVARFDATCDATLTLRESGVVLSADAVAPIAVIASDVLSSLPHDRFRIVGGSLYEERVTVRSSQPEPDLEEPGLLSRLQLSYQPHSAPDAYYDNPQWNAILAAYAAELPDASFSFPATALGVIRALHRIAGGRMLVLASDRGPIHDSELRHPSADDLLIPGGASLSVNFNAIARDVVHAGGSVLTESAPSAPCTAAFLLDVHQANYPRLVSAYEEALVLARPTDTDVLRGALERAGAELTLDEHLALLRLSGWDAVVLVDAFPILIAQLPEASDGQREALASAILQTWALYIPVGEPQDVPFFLGTLLGALGRDAEALTLLQRSIVLHGPDPRTFHQMALCLVRAGDVQGALAHLDQALAVEAFAPAAELRAGLLAGAIPSPGDSG